MIRPVRLFGFAVFLFGISHAVPCGISILHVELPSAEDLGAWDRARLVEFIVAEHGLSVLGDDSVLRAALLDRVDDLELLAGDDEDSAIVAALARDWERLGEAGRARETWERLARDWERSYGLPAWLEVARLARKAEDQNVPLKPAAARSTPTPRFGWRVSRATSRRNAPRSKHARAKPVLSSPSSGGTTPSSRGASWRRRRAGSEVRTRTPRSRGRALPQRAARTPPAGSTRGSICSTSWQPRSR